MTEPATPPASPTPFPRRATVGRGRARLLARGTSWTFSGLTSHSGGAASDLHRLPWALSLIPVESVSVRVNRSQAAGCRAPSNGGVTSNQPASAGRLPRKYQRRQQKQQLREPPDKDGERPCEVPRTRGPGRTGPGLRLRWQRNASHCSRAAGRDCSRGSVRRDSSSSGPDQDDLEPICRRANSTDSTSKPSRK